MFVSRTFEHTMMLYTHELFLFRRYNWMVILAWVFCFTISAFAGAVEQKSGWYGFVAVWDMLLLIAYSVGGTMIIRNVSARSRSRAACEC